VDEEREMKTDAHHWELAVLDASLGKLGIVSHGWKDSKYVNLWTVG